MVLIVLNQVGTAWKESCLCRAFAIVVVVLNFLKLPAFSQEGLLQQYLSSETILIGKAPCVSGTTDFFKIYEYVGICDFCNNYDKMQAEI